MKVSELSTATTTDALRGMRPNMPVRLAGGPQYVWREGDTSVERIVASGTISEAARKRILGAEASLGDVAVNLTKGDEAIVVGVKSDGVAVSRDIFSAGDEYVIGTVNGGLYLTSSIPGYGPGEVQAGRWKAQVAGLRFDSADMPSPSQELAGVSIWVSDLNIVAVCDGESWLM